MITVQQEERLGKIFAFMAFIPILFVKEDMLKLYLLIPILLVSLILTIRRYRRDKKAGRPLLKYYLVLGFILLSFVVAYTFYLFTVS